MSNEEELRSIWYLNVNSESGTAIGKCGSKGSNLTDLDITAGFITASLQLSHEMVKSDEVSQHNFEDIKGGSKRLTLYSTWGNEISIGGATENVVPVITSMLQVSAPKMEEHEYADILRFLGNTNDEIIYRFMIGELTKERTIDPIINIDIINNVLKKHPFSKKGRLIGTKSERLAQLLPQTLKKIFENDTYTLNHFFSKIPLESTCNQNDYKIKVNELGKLIKRDINSYLDAEKKLDYIRKVKIYREDNSLSQLRDKYNSYLDKEESFFEKNRALILSLEKWYLSLDEIYMDLKESKKYDKADKILKFQDLLPQPSSLNDFIKKIRKEFTDEKTSSTLKFIEEQARVFKSEQEFSNLKNIIETSISLIEEIVHYKGIEEIEAFKDYYLNILEEKIPVGEGFDTEIVDYRKEVRKIVNSLRKNFVSIVINSLYDKLFNSYGRFKYVIVYSGEFKQLIIKETIKHINSFFEQIQNYSFAAILERIIKNIKPDTVFKFYSVELLKSLLQNYLYDHYINNPFLIDKKNPLIALDSYTLRFCSELINETRLNEDIYVEIDKIDLLQEYKESFIQILDSTGLTRNNVAQELQKSSNLINSWVDKIDKMINELGVKPDTKSINDFFIDCEKIVKSKKKDKKTMSRKFFIKETIFKNTEPDTPEREELSHLYSKKSEIQNLIKEFENLKKSPDNLFGEKQFDDLLIDLKTILANELESNRQSVKKLLSDIPKLIDRSESERLGNLIDCIKDAQEFFKDKQKLKELEEGIKGIVKYGEFENIFNNLDTLDNEFLKLDGYAHIKGIIKTITSSEPLIEESKIERIHKSRDLLMEALIETYAQIYEDYYGRFTFQNLDTLGKKKTGTILDAGRFFRLQYEDTAKQLEFQNGLKVLQNLIDTIDSNASKFKYFNMNFLLNYLHDYAEHKNAQSAEESVALFNNPATIDDYFEFLFNYFTDLKMGENLKGQLSKYYSGLVDYITGKAKSKPKLPIELNMFKDEVITALSYISDNINDKNKTYYKDGKGAQKDHPSKNYNIKKVPEKKVDLLIDEVADMEHLLIFDTNILKKNYTYVPPRITPDDEIVQRVSNDLKIDLKNEIVKYGLSEDDFEDINRINVMALLLTDEYEVPRDIKMNLIFEGRYDKKSVKALIDASSKISELLKVSMGDVIKKDDVLNDVLNIKIISDELGEYIDTPLRIPESISNQNRNKIFGPNAVWDRKDKTLLKGFKLSIDMTNKENFGQAMRTNVYNGVRKELKPLINFMNKYSREIHSGFDEVYNKLYEK